MNMQVTWKKTIARFNENHLNAIIVISLFILTGFLFRWLYFEQPVNESQFQSCEQLVQNMYDQYDLIDSYNISVSTTIKISNVNRGKIIVTIQDGKIIMIRDYETAIAILRSLVSGLLFGLMPTLVGLIFGLDSLN